MECPKEIRLAMVTILEISLIAAMIIYRDGGMAVCALMNGVVLWDEWRR